MAVLTAQGIARVSIPMLNRALVLPRTFTQVPADGFTGPNGETITVRVRLPRTANEQTVPGAGTISYAAQNEVGVDVNLKHLYDAIRLSDEDLSLNLEDFAAQITEPQVGSIAAGAETQAYGVLNALAADDSFAATDSDGDTKTTLQGARKWLSDHFVPVSDRFLACSTDVINRLLNVDEFVRADALGDGASSALRDAVFGRVYGFTVLEAPGLTAGTAVAYHRSGMLWANKKPADPRGASETAAISDQGINIRQIFDYDPDILSDRSVLSTFAGAAAVWEDIDESTPEDNFRWYKMDTASS